MLIWLSVFLFFKQKTAYEMRISDWSSDVCSSDLYKIGEIFGELKNRITTGYNLREIIEHIDALRFRSQAEKHELSHLYEAKIRNMGNAGRNGGEYYTPRPLIGAIVRVTAPQLGESIYDAAEIGRAHV